MAGIVFDMTFSFKEVKRLLSGWGRIEIQRELEVAGLNAGQKPNLSLLHFVQIDEFYPINPKQQNSFFHYVNRFYLQDLGLDPKKSLMINCNDIGLPKGSSLEDVWPEMKVDLSLRFR